MAGEAEAEERWGEDEINEHRRERGERDQEPEALNITNRRKAERGESHSENGRGAHHRAASMFKGIPDRVFNIPMLIKVETEVVHQVNRIIHCNPDRERGD